MAFQLPEYEIRLTRVPEGLGKTALPWPYNLGLRSKLGGKPDWIQGEETPFCKGCREPMSFIAQIDSIDAVSSNLVEQHFMIGDCGMIYVFHCFECMESGAVSQCY
jgi:hypothetical protein